MKSRWISFFALAARLCLVAIPLTGCDFGEETTAAAGPRQLPATQKVHTPLDFPTTGEESHEPVPPPPTDGSSLGSPPWIDGFRFLEKNVQGYLEYRQERTGIVFVLLPGGEFEMGSPADELDREVGVRGSREGPVHTVALSPFLIAKYEVTQAEYVKVMGVNPSRFRGVDLPVEQVSWNDLRSDEGFLARTGLSLPTEAQWEYACRAGQRGPYSGSGKLDDMGWSSANSGRKTHPVGHREPNQFGLHDLHGSLWEWCQDVYVEGFYDTVEASGLDPVAVGDSEHRVQRGGSWYNLPGFCRSANRNWELPSIRFLLVGFRPVRN